MLNRISNINNREALFLILSGLILLSICASLLLNQPALFVLPVLFLGAYVAVVDYKWFYYLLFISLPISINLSIGGGFSMDTPSEPLMLLISGIFILLFAQNSKLIPSAYLKHPITLLLILHLSWLVIATINSSNYLVSIKFILAKSWFVIPFYFFSLFFIRDKEEIYKIFWIVFYALMATVIIVIVRHALIGFTFREQYTILGPFYSNHVVYANLVAFFVPWVALMIPRYKKDRKKYRILIAALILLIAATYFSYTRAAYVALVIAAAAYVVVRLKLMKYVLALALAGMLGLVANLVHDNKYLDYAPEFETTIAHRDFDKLMSATAKGEDLSTMERLYRWVAGFRMVESNPVFGFGPGNFYFFYKPYTLNRFRTYMSHNPEKSGTHNYYLMTATDQGVPGLLIFIGLCFFVLIHGENMYHRLVDKDLKNIVMAVLLSLIVTLSFLIINDMIELDKIGSFFFWGLALLVIIDNRYIKRVHETS